MAVFIDNVSYYNKNTTNNKQIIVPAVQKSTGINLIELSKYKSTLNPKVKPKIVETRFDTSLEPSRRAWKKVSAEASAESKEINNVEEVLQSKLYPVKKTTTQKDTSVQEDSGEVTDTDVEATTIGKSYRRKIEEDKEENTKIKIKALAKKTVDDALRQLESISSFQEQFHLTGPYKAGFLLSMLHKCRDDLNELFNVAVKYKDEYEALDHLRIFELVVHTNLDMTNLVRQLMKYTNGTTETMQKQIMWPQPAYDI